MHAFIQQFFKFEKLIEKKKNKKQKTKHQAKNKGEENTLSS